MRANDHDGRMLGLVLGKSFGPVECDALIDAGIGPSVKCHHFREAASGIFENIAGNHLALGGREARTHNKIQVAPRLMAQMRHEPKGQASHPPADVNGRVDGQEIHDGKDDPRQDINQQMARTAGALPQSLAPTVKPP